MTYPIEYAEYPITNNGEKMKLTIKEIRYIRQSLEYRAKYYESQPEHYKKYLNELKPIIKKFIKLRILKLTNWIR